MQIAKKKQKIAIALVDGGYEVEIKMLKPRERSSYKMMPKF